jgi:hypothetical protein
MTTAQIFITYAIATAVAFGVAAMMLSKNSKK